MNGSVALISRMQGDRRSLTLSRWSWPALPTPGHSDRYGTFRPGSGWCLHSGRAGGHSLREDPRHQAPAMAHRAVGTPANQGGRARAANRIARRAWAMMSKAERYREPDAPTAGNADRSIPRSGQPTSASAFRKPVFDRDLIRGGETALRLHDGRRPFAARPSRGTKLTRGAH